MTLNSSLTSSVNDIAAKPHVLQQLNAIELYFPPDNPESQAAAPPYGEATVTQAKEENDQRKDTVLVLPYAGRPTSSGSVHSQQSQSLGSVSIRVEPRYSLGSMRSVPSSALEDDDAIWPGHQTCNQWSAGQSTTSQRVDFPNLVHKDSKGSYKKGKDGLILEQSKHMENLVSEPSLPPAPAPANTYEDTEKSQVDLESLRHRKVLSEMGRLSIRRKFVIITAVVVALIALLAMIFMLSFHSSKKMARAAFTGSTTVVFFCVSAVLWAAERTMVETLIAMNMVIVYGIFLNGQIDVWLSYEAIR